VRETREKGEGIAQRSQRPRRGIGMAAVHERPAVNTRESRARNT
jgi:hypothetical protein